MAEKLPSSWGNFDWQLEGDHLNFYVFFVRFVEHVGISDLSLMLETNLAGFLFCRSDSYSSMVIWDRDLWCNSRRLVLVNRLFQTRRKYRTNGDVTCCHLRKSGFLGRAFLNHMIFWHFQYVINWRRLNVNEEQWKDNKENFTKALQSYSLYFWLCIGVARPVCRRW